MVAYHRPPRWRRRSRSAPRGPVTVLAGGTDVYPAKAARAGWGDMRHADILDISARAGPARHRRGGGSMAHRRAHHLERCHPRRAAGAVRRPEARRARGRRRADPEPRHARRQHLHGLAGRRRRAQPAGARCRASSWRAGTAGAWCRWPTSSTAIATPHAAPTRSSPRSSCPKRSSATRSHFLKLGARKYLVISIVMVAGVIEVDRHGSHRGGASRHRLLLGRAAAPAGLGSRLIAQPSRRLRSVVAASHLDRLWRRSTTSAARRPTGARRRWR